MIFVLDNATIESKTNRITYTSQYGNYNFSLKDTGHFDVSLLSNYNYFSASPLNQHAYFSGFNQIDSLNDFAIQPAMLGMIYATIPLGAFRPGFNGSYLLNYENVGSTTQNPTIVFGYSLTLVLFLQVLHRVPSIQILLFGI
ncbi:MAG: hypothetical protein IPK10_18940 [Bacteroidetes bacterium]|nr:hypothetical protein [Bacteroidota bacterium]